MEHQQAVKIVSWIRSQRGFSMIEVLVVIGIIGITAAIVVPNVISFREKARIRASAADMLSTFRNAQIDAAKRNFNMVILFDAANAKATTFLDNGQGAGGNANNSIQDGSEPVIRELQIPAGCSIPDAKITFAAKKTGFSPRGLPLSIGAIEIHPADANLKVRYKVSLSLAGHSKLEASTDNGTTWK